METPVAPVAGQLLSCKTLINRAWVSYKANFKKLWPLFLFGGLAGFNFSSRYSSTNMNTLSHISVVWIVLLVVCVVFIQVMLFLSKISLLRAVSDIHKGQAVSFKDAYKGGLSIFWGYIFIAILAGLSQLGALAFFIVPALILNGYIGLSIYELASENKRGFQALLGSWAIVKGRWWKIFFKSFALSCYIFCYILLWLLAMLLMLAPGFILYFFGQATIALVYIAIVVVVFGTIMSFIQSFALFVGFELYFNLKETAIPEAGDRLSIDGARKSKLIICIIMSFFVAALVIFGYISLNKYISEKLKSMPQKPAMNSVEGGVSNMTASSTLSLSNELQKVPYVNNQNTFEMNLPIGWTVATSTTSNNSSIKSTTSFVAPNNHASIVIKEFNIPHVKQSLPNLTDDQIATGLAEKSVSAIHDEFNSWGLMGFKTIDLKKVALNDKESVFISKGSASYGPPDNITYDFTIFTEFNKEVAYEVTMVWQESDYGVDGKVLFASLATLAI